MCEIWKTENEFAKFAIIDVTHENIIFDDCGFIRLIRNDKITGWNLIAIPYAGYDDLIEEADELLDGYESSKEMMERYKMLK